MKHIGKVSHEDAVAYAESEFEKFRLTQLSLFESDFDKTIKKPINPKSNDSENIGDTRD